MLHQSILVSLAVISSLHNISPTWKILMKDVDFGEPICVALKENIRFARILWIITEVCSKQGLMPGLWKIDRNKSHRES